MGQGEEGGGVEDQGQDSRAGWEGQGRMFGRRGRGRTGRWRGRAGQGRWEGWGALQGREGALHGEEGEMAGGEVVPETLSSDGLALSAQYLYCAA